jgi:hypothetical protein
MKKLILAVALTTFAATGAFAEASLEGNYDGAVLNSQPNLADVERPVASSFNASIPSMGGMIYGNQDPAVGNYSANVTETDIRH